MDFLMKRNSWLFFSSMCTDRRTYVSSSSHLQQWSLLLPFFFAGWLRSLIALTAAAKVMMNSIAFVVFSITHNFSFLFIAPKLQPADVAEGSYDGWLSTEKSTQFFNGEMVNQHCNNTLLRHTEEKKKDRPDTRQLRGAG